MLLLRKISAFWARIELFFAACLAFIVTVLIFLNVVTRTLGTALFWVDELAIYTMVWMTFLGASAALHFGHTVSITFLTNKFTNSTKNNCEAHCKSSSLSFFTIYDWILLALVFPHFS